MFNPNDVYGLGVGSIDFGGFDAAGNGSSSSSSTSHASPPNDATRRKCVADMVAWLRTHRGNAPECAAHTFDAVLAGACLLQTDRVAREALHMDLRANTKVTVSVSSSSSTTSVRYRPTHVGLCDADTLHAYVALFTHGLPADELADAYDGVEADIARLVAQRTTMYAITDPYERKRTVLFAVDPEYAVPVDADLRALYANATPIPESVADLEARLHEAGLITAAQRTTYLERSRLACAQHSTTTRGKTSTRRSSSMTRATLTNAHLVGQYEWLPK
jgi:hypothetical protein